MTSKKCDIAIIGAGPYGLSLAAHLAETSLAVRIFGAPMGTWLGHMPAGMSLKSEGFASNLYHPGGEFKLGDFCRENGIPYADIGVPVSLDTFSSYGLAFQQKFVPHLEESLVCEVTRQTSGFRVVLENGETVDADRVVVAAGIRHFESVPAPLAALSPEFVSHSSRFHRYDQFSGKDVVVVGAGSSAIDVAISLHEAGARPQLITRRSTVPFHGKAADKRSLMTRITNPWSGLGPGWRSRLACDLPLVFHRMSPKFRLNVVKKHLGPAPGWFTRDKMQQHVPMHVGLSLARAGVADNKAQLTFVDAEGKEQTFAADHVIAGTGYRVDLGRLNFLGDTIRKEIAIVETSPILSKHFESTVPGLYFVGAAAAASFGPLLRFAFGAGFTSRHLSRHLKRVARRRSVSAQLNPGRSDSWAGAAVPEKQ